MPNEKRNGKPLAGSPRERTERESRYSEPARRPPWGRPLIACIGRALVIGSALLAAAARADEPNLQTGPWRAWLDSPGGELPFELQIEQAAPLWRATVINGEERLDVPRVIWRGREIVLEFDLYQATIEAAPNAAGNRLDGRWKKARASGKNAELPFHATAGRAPRFAPSPSLASRPAGAPTPAVALRPRWAARFAKDTDPAVALLDTRRPALTTGTFLTPTGDYRYLAGDFDGQRLRLSCFDGSHAFLFDARLRPDGTLAGDFWSGDTWHDTWTAAPDDKAALPEAIATPKPRAAAPSLADLKFPDIWGDTRSVADYPGKARIISVFGTWCPNCNDEARYLVELDKRFHDRGLAIVGLAFELSGDLKRDTQQVRRFAARFGIEYPLLIGGVSDRAKASAALPIIDGVRAYPTTIFLHADGRVRAVHTGYSGPATGDEHRRMRAEWEKIIEELLNEPDGGKATSAPHR